MLVEQPLVNDEGCLLFIIDFFFVFPGEGNSDL